MRLEIDTIKPNADSRGTTDFGTYTKPKVKCPHVIKLALIDHIMGYSQFREGMEINIRFKKDYEAETEKSS
jgi:hypothetical protein